MKYIDEYRDPVAAQKLIKQINQTTTQPWSLMEICGGQTHSILKFGIDQVLPEQIRLIHGPGCPVCVTPISVIDKALEVAAQPNVIFCSFGDMLRVPGSEHDLFSVKANGANVRMVYSPLDALTLARKHPEKQVVFFAVGFETTAPTDAMAVLQAHRENLNNFSILVSHVLVPPAIEAILSSPQNQVQAFLAAGHVCTVMGYHQYEMIAKKYQTPIVVTGFEPLDILHGILMAVTQLEEGRAEVENQYARAVKREGNLTAQKALEQVFDIDSQAWRGIGEIPQSGFRLKDEFSNFDAEQKFGAIDRTQVQETQQCISGEILQGIKKPHQCPSFGITCTPEKPLGAPMVSSEGACAAYFRYRRAEVVG